MDTSIGLRSTPVSCAFNKTSVLIYEWHSSRTSQIRHKGRRVPAQQGRPSGLRAAQGPSRVGGRDIESCDPGNDHGQQCFWHAALPAI